jgi:hypothetical protein
MTEAGFLNYLLPPQLADHRWIRFAPKAQVAAQQQPRRPRKLPAVHHWIRFERKVQQALRQPLPQKKRLPHQRPPNRKLPQKPLLKLLPSPALQCHQPEHRFLTTFGRRGRSRLSDRKSRTGPVPANFRTRSHDVDV